MAIVPCPAITSGSSKGCTKTRPRCAAELECVFVGMIIVVAVQHDFPAKIGDRLHFDLGRGQRHDDDGRNAAGAGAQARPPAHDCRPTRRSRRAAR